MTNKQLLDLYTARKAKIIARGRYRQSPGVLNKVERMIKRLSK